MNTGNNGSDGSKRNSPRRQSHGLAQWAAATELHAEHSVTWTTQHFPEHKAVCSHDDCCGSVADRCTRASRGSLQVAYATLRRVNAFAAEIRGMPMLARWATLGVLFAGVTGGIVGLIVGLVAYAPTAPFAAVELGFPAALAGGVVGLVAGLTAATASRIRRHAASLEAPGSAGRAQEAQDG
jgi:hypothetical protein